jgi:predicted DNA-binding protein with PD1-like motif
MTLIQRGKVEDIIYARLDPGADLMLSLHEVCKQEGVTTGVVLDITGAMANLHVEHFPTLGYAPTADLSDAAAFEEAFIDMEGPLEVSGHGLIGEGWAPGVEPPDPRGFFYASFKAHGDPYFHIHIVGTNAERTICGHLLEGSRTIGRPGGVSNFTVVIAKVSGVRLRAIWEKNGEEPTTFRHELTPA